MILLLSYSLTLISSSLCASTYTQEICVTKLGNASLTHLGTTTCAFTTSLKKSNKLISTPSTTITPQPITYTVTSTTFATTTVGKIDTFAVTSTIIFPSTIYITDISTVIGTFTTTVTSATTTTTIPPSAGFTPIQSEASYIPKKRFSKRLGGQARRAILITPRKHTRAEQQERGAAPAYQLQLIGDKPRWSPPLFPSTVTCEEMVEAILTTTITLTAKGTISVTAKAPKTTQTLTSTAMRTIILVEASTTITILTTLTSMTTLTTIETTTSLTTATATAIVPTATFYEACATNNMVSSANGGQAIGSFGTKNPPSGTIATSAYDCCVICLLTTNCGGIAYANFGCDLAIVDLCDPSQSSGTNFNSDSTQNPNYGFTISNSNCGQVANGGSLG